MSEARLQEGRMHGPSFRRLAPCWFALAALLFAGCSGQPIPLSGHAGATFTLALGSEQFEQAGFRSVVTQAFSDDDTQRGELVFRLCPIPPPTPPADPCPAQETFTLVTKYVTALTAHRASEAGIKNEFLVAGASVDPVAEVMVWIDIPPTVDPGTYNFDVKIKRNGALEDFLEFTDFGTFEVLPGGPEDPNPFFSILNDAITFGDAETKSMLYQTVPKPVLELEFDGGVATDLAAATITLSYAEDKIRVRSVHEANQLGQGSIVRFSHTNFCYELFDPDPTFEICIAALGSDDSLVIHLVDPDQLTKRLAVAFELRDVNVTTEPTDFTITEAISYNLSGGQMSEQWLIDLIR